MADAEFREIAHCGGQFIVTNNRAEDGSLRHQLRFHHSRPLPMVLFGVYALQQGIPVGMIEIGGMGQPFNRPPFPYCLSIFVASDSEGRTGHECPQCQGYWRSVGAIARWAMTCPYCGFRVSAHEFLTKGQRAYVEACCRLIMDVWNSEEEGEKKIDMDAAVDAATRNLETPKFYYVEQSQQTKFECSACGQWNDILGRFGYCSSCGTRNDLAQLGAVVTAARARIHGATETDLNACVRDLVGSFDTIAQQYAKQLIDIVPLTARRRRRFENHRFHDLRRCAKDFIDAFDIDVLAGVDEDDVKFGVMMFERRHVYEHKGGEADERYMDRSGDSSVRLKQIIHEKPEHVHRLAGLIDRLGRNLHDGFHEVLPPEEAPIELKQQMDKIRGPAQRQSINSSVSPPAPPSQQT